MGIRKGSWLLSSVGVFSLALMFTPDAARGQGSSATGETREPEEPEEPEEIVVTAQFRNQKLQDVPSAVTVLTEKSIEDAGIRTTTDFVSLTPNLTFDDSFTYLNSFVVIRGVTQINNADSPVAIIVDGVPQNNQKQFKQTLFDVQQIEVLKGPQGALYGRNAIGGAINIKTRQPTNEYEGFIGGSLENGLGYRAQAGISGPIVKNRILFRVSGSYYKTNGIIENTFLNDEVDDVDFDYSLRGKLTVLPLDNLRIDLRASYNEFEAGSSYDAVVNNTPNGAVVPIFRMGDANDVFSPTSDFRGFTTGDVTDLSGRFDLDLRFATATYILGYTKIDESYRADLDFSNPAMASGIFGGLSLGQGQNLRVGLFSHEVRLVSPDERPIRWIAGAYYLDTQRDLLTRAFLDENNTPEQFDDGMILADLNENNDNRAWALFGQLEFDVTERLTLQVGARYDKDEREQVDPDVADSQRSLSFDSFQPKVTVSYDIIDQALGYATYSTGFRSGGFNAPGVVLETFQDETLTNYEIGLKIQFRDLPATLNFAGFLSQSDDFQFFFVDVTTGSQIISNLGQVDIRGLDIDFNVRVPGGLTFFGGIGVTDSEITAIDNADLESFLTDAGVDTDRIIGNRSPRTTEMTFNLGGQIDARFADWLRVMFRMTYEYQGEKSWQLDNQDVRDPIHLLGLRASLDAGYASVAVWGKNLLDEAYYADFNPAEFAGTGFDLGFQARPRTFGIDVQARF